MLFGRFRILGKLALLVFVPLLGVLALSVPIIYDRVEAARSAQETSDTVQLATEVSTALQELHEERLLAVGYSLGIVDRPTLVVQSAEAADEVTEILDEHDDLSKELRRALTKGVEFDAVRQSILNRALNPNEIVTEFSTLATGIIDKLALSLSADLTTSVGRQVFALEQAMRSDEMISQAGCYLTVATAIRTVAPDDAMGMFSLFFSTLTQIEQIIENSRSFFTESQYKLYMAAQTAFSGRVGPQFLTDARTSPAQALGQLKIQTLFPSLQSVMVLGGFVEKRVAADVDDIVNNNRESALRDAYLLGGGALLLLVVVVTLSLFMARAVARPLRRLTVSADRIARAAESELERVADDESEAQVRPIRLDAVDVEARDEIGDLARAFDRVQTTAARLVERQVLGRRNVALMFGHVGRRTQNLVGRQLSLIDSLERKETDSERLRELYRLDHMSSRLRRNASSLVVLSGGAGANEHMAPLPLSDVVRLALGEIEDYTRVEVDVPEEIVVVPAVVADLTLLLAELLENATSFSPPHTEVTVTADELRGGARLAVIDRGLGLTPERLAEENARLTRRERLDLAPTEVLGLFVVGRLARRHGIEVTLTDTPDGGVTAWVDLSPAHLVNRVENLTVAQPPAYPSAPPAPAQYPAVPQYQTAPQYPAAPQHQAAPQYPSTPQHPAVAAQYPSAAQYPGAAQPPAPQQYPAAAPQYPPAPANAQVSAALRGNTTEVAIAGAARRTAPGSQQPFDPNVLSRATHTLESGASWNAFGAPAAGRPAAGAPVQAGPSNLPGEVYAGQPVYDAEPVYSPRPAYQEPAVPYEAPAYDLGAPVAGRVPAMPELPPAQPAAPGWTSEPAPRPAWNGQVPAVETPPAPAAPAQLPRQRTGDDNGFAGRTPQVSEAAPPALAQRPRGAAPLRRRIPGSQLPAETGAKQHASAPSQDDATAARAAFDAFEAGVSRAQWDAAETEMASPPAAGHAPLTRRVPGATLPHDEQDRPAAPAAPAQPLDPEAARALMDQFEYGVALALNETQPQPEGQPR